MQVTFYGVRGSIPAPGPHTARYGGETVCVTVDFDDGRMLVLEAGSGLRSLGKRLAQSNDEILLFLSHQHWDHILGFPFFKPAYQPNRRIRVFCDWPEDEVLPALLRQMQAPLFPVTHDGLKADIQVTRIKTGQSFEILPGVWIHAQALNHPNGGLAFRIEADGRKLAFVTDNELHPPPDSPTTYQAWVEFVRGCNLLIHDATYRLHELESKKGWGHSAFEQAVNLACDSGVPSLVLFDHETDRSDDELDRIGVEASELAQGRCRVLVARESMTVRV